MAVTFLRTLLALCRVSALPTVWSNCLAGWWLGGGGNVESLPLLFGGATLIYLGGAFLNDAFDANYDRDHRRARPVPSGAVSLKTVWRWGLGFVAAGGLLLIWAGRTPGGLGLGLIFLILLYDAFHRLVTFSPVVLGLCRFFLYLVGASIAQDGVSGWSIWCGLALGAYVSGHGGLA